MAGWRQPIASRLAGLASATAIACCAAAPAPNTTGNVELAATRPAREGEAVWLEIRTGPLPRGTEIRVSTAAGELLGTVSPFGAARGAAGGAHLIALPQGAVAGGRVRIRLEVDVPGKPARAPRAGEVLGAELVFVPVTP